MRTLDEGYQAMRASALPEHAALYIDCLAWFCYFTDGQNLAVALSTYEK